MDEGNIRSDIKHVNVSGEELDQSEKSLDAQQSSTQVAAKQPLQLGNLKLYAQGSSTQVAAKEPLQLGKLNVEMSEGIHNFNLNFK
jgi:hypothetical protein